MNDRVENQSVHFRHLVLEGTSYDAGYKLGAYIRSENTMRDLANAQALTSKEKEHVQQAMECFDCYCPGLNDEIKGLSDGLGVDVEQIICYISSYRGQGGCSQMVVLPRITENGHIYLARNYDYWPKESDLCLIITKIDKKAHHIGFSELGLGRNDGINEHGLCISMSNAAPGRTSPSKGIEFWVIIRSVLDSCSSVDEAIELINDLPTSTYANFIIADRKDDAALVEVAENNKAVQRINPETDNQYLCATNHYISESMLAYETERYWDSVARYKAMELRINDGIPNVDKSHIKGIQSNLMPLGICTHDYSSGFGTLWSAIYDASDMSLEVCFGSPRSNDWHLFDLNSTHNHSYSVYLPHADKKPIWKRLPAGANDCSVYELIK